MTKMLFIHLNVALVSAILFLPPFVNGFSFVHHHYYFDAFKAQRQFQSNVGPYNPNERLGSSKRFAFSFLVSSPPPSGDQDETKNRTLSNKDNSSEPAMDSNNCTETNSSSTTNKTTVQLITQSNDSKNKQSRGRAPYFPFSFQAQPTLWKEPPIATAVETSADKTKKGSSSNNSSSIINSSATALLNKEANETITVADLEVLLQKMQSDSNSVGATDPKRGVSRKRSTTNGLASTKTGSFETTTSTKSASASSSSQVAFPQPSDVSETDIRRSTAITGCFLGMIIGITILPNLWLVGMIAGVLYGYEITKDLDEYEQVDQNAVANFMISSATRLAKVYRKAVDGVKALWFLYKTGQLSYEYYKSYETLDKKFAIQEKVDAWNKVFVKGKQRFDAWEKENEVGRKVLAGIRTAWLLDEESRLRAEGRSRYRLVQSFYDLRRSASRLLKKMMTSTRTLLEEGGLQTFWKGLQTDLRREGSLSVRLGAIGAAVVAVNVCGALFSLSAGFSNLLAIIGAVIWPSWTKDLLSRTQEIWLETQSRGSNEKGKFSGNILENIQQWYEEYSSDRMKESRSSQRTWRRGRPNRKQAPLVAKLKNRKPKRSAKRTQSSRFGLGKRQTRRNGDIGTWGNFRRTR